MTTTEFINNIITTYAKGVEILKKKNRDYATSDDPFKNFKSSIVINIPPEDAIMVRILDKLARIGNLLHKDAEVKDEAIEDTIIDAINYLAILKAKLDENKSLK